MRITSDMEYGKDYFGEDIRPKNFDMNDPRVKLIAGIWEDLGISKFTVPDNANPYKWGVYDTNVAVLSVLQNKLLDIMGNK